MFNAVIHFRKSDVLPWLEIVYDETLVAWLTQGLPLNALQSLTGRWAEAALRY